MWARYHDAAGSLRAPVVLLVHATQYPRRAERAAKLMSRANTAIDADRFSIGEAPRSSDFSSWTSGRKRADEEGRTSAGQSSSPSGGMGMPCALRATFR